MPEVWCAPPKSIYAVEMRLKRILEAVAERICCPEAHRSVWRNWILEGHTALSAHRLPAGRLHNLYPRRENQPHKPGFVFKMCTRPAFEMRFDVRYFTFSANISRKLIVRIPPEIQMARNPRCMERFPPIPAPIAKKKIIPK